MSATVEVSWGELIDKYTILQIKSYRIKDKTKLVNIQVEMNALKEQYENAHNLSNKLIYLEGVLRGVNETLWDIEDKIRDCEREGNFGEIFITLARSVYIQNDKRADLKREINLLLKSSIVEEKSYKPYN